MLGLPTQYPPSPSLPLGCAGGGKEVVFSGTSRGFGYGYEAVRIKVKEKTQSKRYFYDSLSGQKTAEETFCYGDVL
jgi:hypothetical protein